MTTLGTLNVRLTASTAEMSRGFDRAASKIRALTSKLQGIAIASAAAAAPLAMLGRSALKAAGEFERGMVRASAIARASPADYERMTKAAKSLAATTEFTARQVADAMGNLAQRGFDATKIIGAMPGVLQLASAAQMDVADTAAIASSVLNAYGFGVGQLTRVNDSLIAASNRAAIDIAGIGEAFKHVGNVGATFRIDLEEMVAALGLLGNVGVPAEMAGTAIKGLLPVLSGAAHATGKSRKQLDELGFTALAIATDGFPTLAQVAETVAQALDRIGDEAEVNAKLMDLFGKRAGPGLLGLARAGREGIERLTKAIKEAGGEAERIATRQLQTFAGRVKILESQFEGLQITLGNRLMPVIKRFTDGLSGAISWFEKLSPATQSTIAELGAYVTGILAALSASSLLVTVLGPLTGVLSLVGKGIKLAFTKPILAAVGAIAGLVLLAGSLKQAWETNLFGVRTAWEVTVQAFETGAQSIGEALRDTFESISPWVSRQADKLIEFGQKGRQVMVIDHETGIASPTTERTKARNPRERLQDDIFHAGSMLKMGFDAEFGREVAERVAEATGRATERQQQREEQNRRAGIKPADSRGFVEQAVADIKQSFERGLEVLGPTAAAIVDGALDLAGSGLESVLGERFSALKDALGDAVGSVRDLIESIRNGSIKIAKAAADAVDDGGGAPTPNQQRTKRDGTEWFGEGLRRAGFLPSRTKDEQGRERLDLGAVLGNIPGLESLANTTDAMSGAASDGALGGIADGAMSGGLLGALIGLLTSSEQFQQILDVLGAILGEAANIIGMVFVPLRPVIGAIGLMINSILMPLAPLFEALGAVLEPLAPVLMVVGELIGSVLVVLKPFEVLFKILGTVLGAIARVLWWVLKGVGYVVITILLAISWVWNAILDAFIWILDKLTWIPFVGGAIEDLIGEIEGAKIDRSGLFAARKELEQDLTGNLNDGFTAATGKAADNFERLAKTTAALNESLRNIPEGFKVAAKRYQSMSLQAQTGYTDTVTIPAMASGGLVRRSTLALIGEAGPEAVVPLDRLGEMGGEGGGGMHIHGPITVMANNPRQFLEELQRLEGRQNLLRYGTAARTAPKWTGR